MQIIIALILDLLFGDPMWIKHPVVIMGKCISKLEKALRKAFSKTPKGELAAGAVLATVLPLGTIAFTLAVLHIAGMIHPYLRFAIETFWCYQCIAVRDMLKESKGVYKAITTGTLEDGQKAVGRIVGRDTSVLDERGVIKAAVETVAENFSDGVVAPLFYMMIGLAPLAMMYKSINTMDSMIAYKNEKYLFFGRVAARLDDAFGFIPARLSALFMILSAPLTGQSGMGGFRIWKRDRYNHASPNAAQTESVMAGALKVQLAGPAQYFGEVYDKPTIGDDVRPIEAEDILRANRMFLVSSVMCAGVFAAIRYVATVII